MAGGRVLIGGTAYKITGGVVGRGGYNYPMRKGGKALINGTGYKITFQPISIENAFKSAITTHSSGVESSTAAQAYVSLTTAGTYYAFVFCNGYAGITKLVSNGSSVTKTLLKQTGTDTSYGQVYINGTNCYCSTNGTSAVSYRGQTIICLQFPGYPASEIDTLFSGVTLTRIAGRNASSKSSVSFNSTNYASKFIIVAHNTYMSGVQLTSSGSYTSDITYGNCEANKSLLHGVYSTYYTYYISTDSSTNQTIYGGSILSMT